MNKLLPNYILQNRKFHCIKRNETFFKALDEFKVLQQIVSDSRLELMETLPSLHILHSHLLLHLEYARRALSGVQTGILPTFSEDKAIGVLSEENIIVPLSQEIVQSIDYLIHRLENEIELTHYFDELEKRRAPNSASGFVDEISALITSGSDAIEGEVTLFIQNLTSRVAMLEKLLQQIYQKQKFCKKPL